MAEEIATDEEMKERARLAHRSKLEAAVDADIERRAQQRQQDRSRRVQIESILGSAGKPLFELLRDWRWVDEHGQLANEEAKMVMAGCMARVLRKAALHAEESTRSDGE